MHARQTRGLQQGCRGPANRRSWLCGDPNAKFFLEKKRASTKQKKARKTQPTGACLKKLDSSPKMASNSIQPNRACSSSNVESKQKSKPNAHSESSINC